MMCSSAGSNAAGARLTEVIRSGYPSSVGITSHQRQDIFSRTLISMMISRGVGVPNAIQHRSLNSIVNVVLADLQSKFDLYCSGIKSSKYDIELVRKTILVSDLRSSTIYR